MDHSEPAETPVGPPPSPPPPPMIIHKLDESRCLPQSQSPLFSVLPAEVRNLVFHYVLLPYELEDRKYDASTPYARPGFTCPRRTDTALLRTCQLAYREAFFRPWTSANHTLFFADSDRRPPDATTTDDIRRELSKFKLAGVLPEVECLRIFPQMVNLEPGTKLQEVLDIDMFHPKCITITIRHTDWWWWEYDEALRIAAAWVRECRFPSSVKRVCMELETLKRKSRQVDDIAQQMIGSWFFTRRDGKLLQATEEPTLNEWTGSSVWHGRRWQRDEAREMELDYYVLTLNWRLAADVVADGQKHEHKTARPPPDLKARNPAPLVSGFGIPWPPRRRGFGMPLGPRFFAPQVDTPTAGDGAP